MSTACVKMIEEIIEIELQIPAYQRPYTWEEQNVRQLLEDIDKARMANHNEYQIGALILHEECKKNEQEQSVFNIVDGQQRITTISLILKVLNKDNSLINKLEYNHELSIKNIKNNHSSIQQYFANKEQSEKDDFQTYLLTNCKLVQVTVNEVSEAFQLFDSQNHRGKGLAPHDLLKAFHIRAMRNDTTQLKISVDTKWQEYKNLEEVFKHKLYRIRKWTKHHNDLYFYKKKIGEFKGFDLKNHQYPFHNSLAHYSNYPDYMPNLVPRLQDTLLSSHTQLNQKIINGKHFFDYVDTYSHLHKILFENLDITDKDPLPTLTKFKEFYIRFSRHDPCQYRRGDTYIRLLYEASILAFVDKYGEQELKLAIYQSIYKAVYHLRFRQIRVDEVSVLKNDFAKGFFNTLEHSYEPSEVLVFLNAFINDLKKHPINSPKLSEHMKKVFTEGIFDVK